MFIFSLSIPFAYFNVFGVRLLPLILLISLIRFIIKPEKINNSDLLALFPILCIWIISLFYTLFTGYINSTVSILCFLLISFLTLSFCKSENTMQRLVKIYVYFAVMHAALILIQILVLLFLGIEIFRIEFYKNRIAFSGLWTDFSILSIYLVSALPLAILTFPKSSRLRTFITISLLTGSFLTTARSGLVAFLVVITAVAVITGVNYSLRMKIKKPKISFAMLGIFMIIALFLSRISEISSSIYRRENIFEDQSRIKSYQNAFNFINENILFGTAFNDITYIDKLGYLPHNSILYIWVSGGIFLLFFFFLWLAFIVYYLFKIKENNIKISILIAAVGTMFVPSTFAMYFLAFLYGILAASARR